MKLLQTIIIIVINFHSIIGEGILNTNCGRRLVNLESLVTHGHKARDGEWPWHAAIFYATNKGHEYRCGGSVLNSNTILTAAHCVFENNQVIIPQRFIIHLAKYDLRISSPYTREFESYSVTPHPRFNPENLINDIAIIRLSTEAVFNNYIQPICLWDSSKISLASVLGKFGIVIGFGVTETDELSYILRQATMPVVSSLTCLASNRDFFGQFLSDTNFCAGFRNGTSVCNGDSGGSITFEENGVHRIRGIVSSTRAREDTMFCSSQDYVIFTDVEKYLPWIQMMVPQLKPEIITSVKTVSGKYFFVETSFKANWFKAYEYCRLHQMRLATVLSEEEEEAIVNLVFDKKSKTSKFGAGVRAFWISGSDLGSDNYVWLSTGQPITYMKWRPGEPSRSTTANGEDHCIDINIHVGYYLNRPGEDVAWNDAACMDESHFICETI